LEKNTASNRERGRVGDWGMLRSGAWRCVPNSISQGARQVSIAIGDRGRSPFGSWNSPYACPDRWRTTPKCRWTSAHNILAFYSLRQWRIIAPLGLSRGAKHPTRRPHPPPTTPLPTGQKDAVEFQLHAPIVGCARQNAIISSPGTSQTSRLPG